MRWKDFLYYQKGEKLVVILLLILIILTLVLNLILSQRRSNDIVFTQNDSLIKVFDEFQRNLKEKENRAFVQQNQEISFVQEGKYKSSTAQELSTQNVPDNYSFPKAEKLTAGETISLNSTDTAQWKKIPGIGSSFASRIIKYRKSLGGFVSVEQLREIYGVDSEMFSRISPYIQADGNFKKIQINKLEFKELLSHPYLNYKQVQAIMNLRKKKGNISSVDELAMLDEFTPDDIFRVEPYLEF
ncbi:MAG: helix-hairpin-helix domain-containing protein [Bacteroidia bacterium]|nr:helix-hairpin-helix domain-containing protein [Bacteroidia bacterium]